MSPEAKPTSCSRPLLVALAPTMTPLSSPRVDAAETLLGFRSLFETSSKGRCGILTASSKTGVLSGAVFGLVFAGLMGRAGAAEAPAEAMAGRGYSDLSSNFRVWPHTTDILAEEKKIILKFRFYS